MIIKNLADIFGDIIRPINYTYDSVQGRPLPYHIIEMSGYVHTLETGNAIFITEQLTPYLIPMPTVKMYGLNTGDQIKARIEYSMDYDNYIVAQVDEINHVDYDHAPAVKATRHFMIDQRTVKLGTTAMIKIDDQTDVADRIEHITAQVPLGAEKLILSFDGRKTNFDENDNLYITNPGQTSRDKLMICLLAFFRAKSLAAQNKDVVLVIDSLDKMFTVFNNCMQSGGIIDPDHISKASVTDLENILCSTRCLKDHGTFTILGLQRHNYTKPQEYINTRFHQLFDTII